MAPAKGFGIGAARSPRLLVDEAEARQRLDEAHRDADAVDHRHAELALQVGGEVGHAGAAEHDGAGAVLVERAAALVEDPGAGVRGRVVELQHGELGRPHPPAMVLHAVVAQEVLGDDRGCGRAW